MRPDLFARTLSFADARARVLDAAVPIERTERVAVSDALGRVACRDVIAPLDVPPFDRATMDGYAVRGRDVTSASAASPVVLTCLGRVVTGQASTRTVSTGSCIEVATGAPMPPGTDAVVMVEHTARAGDDVTILRSVAEGQNVGRRGSDITTGQSVIHTGDVIGIARAGALSAVGLTSVDVFAKPTVAIFSTGPEVAPVGTTLGPAQVYDVNTTTLSALVQEHGGSVRLFAPVADSLDALVEALERAADCDVIVTSGGSSVGGKDLLPDAVERCGSVTFHGIAVKPGKPTLFGSIGATPIFGMPGNPTSCLSNAYILLVPFLRAVARLPRWQPRQRSLPLTRRVDALADRHQFYTVRIVDDRAEPAFKSSGDITSMAAADGYIEIPPGPKGIETGEIVTVTLF